MLWTIELKSDNNQKRSINKERAEKLIDSGKWELTGKIDEDDFKFIKDNAQEWRSKR